MRTHPDIGLKTAGQQCSRLAATCAFLAVYVEVSFYYYVINFLPQIYDVTFSLQVLLIVQLLQHR